MIPLRARLVVRFFTSREIAPVTVLTALSSEELRLEGIEEHDSVDSLQRPILRSRDVNQTSIGDLGNEFGGDLGAVGLAQVALDVPGCLPPGGRGDHLSVKAGETVPVFDHQGEFKPALSVARDRDINRAGIDQNRLRARSVAVVAGVLLLRGIAGGGPYRRSRSVRPGPSAVRLRGLQS